jgi:hypothetical protein
MYLIHKNASSMYLSQAVPVQFGMAKILNLDHTGIIDNIYNTGNSGYWLYSCSVFTPKIEAVHFPQNIGSHSPEYSVVFRPRT